MIYQPFLIARQFSFVRETLPNRGLMVEAIQHWSGGSYGDFWCAEFVWFVLSICYQGKPPVPRFQAVQTLYDLAKKNNWIVDHPQANDLYLYVNDSDHAYHIGFITDTGTGIAGNTSIDGKSANGDRVAEHSISAGPHVKYVRLPA